MRKSRWSTVVLIALVCAVVVFAQDQTKTTIKHVPIKHTSPASGQEMFKEYCAACHGADAKGNGPAAPALKSPPTDLTTLAKKNGGKYPDARVAAVLHGKESLTAHGSQEMPIWGNLFSSLSRVRKSEVQLRVVTLTQYIESLQQK